MRIGIYVRVSTQPPAQAPGIEQQLERLQTHVGRHVADGWEVREEHVCRDARPCDATHSQSRAALVRKSTAFPCHL
jgi:hypothetical protein